MSENKKRETWTFFNEEWNQPFWEDSADVIDNRKKSRDTLVED